MKLVGAFSTAVLSLLLGLAAPEHTDFTQVRRETGVGGASPLR